MAVFTATGTGKPEGPLPLSFPDPGPEPHSSLTWKPCLPLSCFQPPLCHASSVTRANWFHWAGTGQAGSCPAPSLPQARGPHYARRSWRSGRESSPTAEDGCAGRGLATVCGTVKSGVTLLQPQLIHLQNRDEDGSYLIRTFCGEGERWKGLGLLPKLHWAEEPPENSGKTQVLRLQG